MMNKSRMIFQFSAIGLLLYVAIRPVFDRSYISDFEQYCPFGGLSSFFSKLNLDAMACSMNETQVMLGFALVLGVGFIGKLFCSHICPIGTVTEWIGRLGKKWNLQKELPEKADRFLRSLKYILLFVTVYFTMTSSELFCKKYDPFFATVNLFGNPDIALPFAITAFVITIGGALFVRMFWCKYLCPLGAFSNIFLNAVAAGGLVVAYAVAYLSGLPIDPLWLLVGLVLVGWVTEVGFLRSLLLPIPRITRNELTCSDCGHCDEQCNQGIKISETASVRHIDCNLCTDCARACPLKNVLTVNNKPRNTNLAPAATVILVVAALLTTNWVEFTTISLRWGKPTGTESLYTQTGMKSIKCYGSSMALAGTLENVEGILGVETYVKTKRVNVFYDSLLISEREVKASLFSSSKTEIRELNLDPNEPVGVFDIGILRLFDAVDFNDLTMLLGEREGILGVETRFGEPVRTTIYYVPSRISLADIRSQLNRKSLLRDGKQVDLNFETTDEGETRNAIRYGEFKSLMFRGYDSEFNGYEQYESEKLLVYKFSMPDAAKPELRTSLDLLASHLSNDEGIVRFKTGFDGTPVGNVYYDPAKTSEAAIRTALENRVLTYFITDSTTEQTPNPFQIKGNGAGGK